MIYPLMFPGFSIYLDSSQDFWGPHFFDKCHHFWYPLLIFGVVLGHDAMIFEIIMPCFFQNPGNSVGKSVNHLTILFFYGDPKNP